MKNDPIIHAKASKIVEAIMKISHPNGRPDFTYWDGRNYDERKEKITSALASLGGEDKHPSEREVLEGDMPKQYEVPIGSLWDYDRSLCHSQFTTALKVKDVRTTASGIVVEFEQLMAYSGYGIQYFDGKTFKPHILKQSPHPSEREVLSGEQFYEKFREVRNELSAVTGTYSLSEAIIKTYDRYLSEKQSKTEQLYCHHNGKYTLKKDGTCCKCHLPLAEKGGKG